MQVTTSYQIFRAVTLIIVTRDDPITGQVNMWIDCLKLIKMLGVAYQFGTAVGEGLL